MDYAVHVLVCFFGYHTVSLNALEEEVRRFLLTMRKEVCTTTMMGLIHFLIILKAFVVCCAVLHRRRQLKCNEFRDEF